MTEGKERPAETREMKSKRVEVIEFAGPYTQQDAWGTREFETAYRKVVVIVVADGHAPKGDKASKAAVDELLKVDNPDEVQGAFTNAHERVVKAAPEAGTTATLVLIREGDLLVAYVGDCEVRLAKQDGHLSTLTIPHQYGVHSGETTRLYNAGAYIDSGTKGLDNPVAKGRIAIDGQTLEPSRVLGDVDFEPYVSHEPEIIETELTGDDKYALVGSDGFWKIVSGNSKKRKKIQKALAESRSASEAKEKIEQMLARWKLFDNTTLVIVELNK
ncbi:MAG: PP2C family protein-serine/threonine phosphatase [Patescibacteria group bacterium]